MAHNKLSEALVAELHSIDQQLTTLERRKDHIRALLRTYSFTESSTPRARKTARNVRRKHRLTAAGRKRLSDMMKKRWAERRKKAKTSA